MIPKSWRTLFILSLCVSISCISANNNNNHPKNNADVISNNLNQITFKSSDTITKGLDLRYKSQCTLYVELAVRNKFIPSFVHFNQMIFVLGLVLVLQNVSTTRYTWSNPIFGTMSYLWEKTECQPQEPMEGLDPSCYQSIDYVLSKNKN